MATITGTSGDDELTGTSGADTYYSSGSMFGDTYYDPGGNDIYYLTSGMSFITDAGGTDVAYMPGLELAELNFMVVFDHAVSISTDTGALNVWFENMVNNPSGGIDSLVLDDVTLTRAQILTYADQFFGFGS
ncbi:MAG TPA: hypothetical protein VMG08_20335 [Allosphingosinicella sp.]|nr:hypothetical protein [Allosphingosinicella sp.]